MASRGGVRGNMPPKLVDLAQKVDDLQKQLDAATAANPGAGVVNAVHAQAFDNPAEDKPTVLKSVGGGLGEIWNALVPRVKSASNDVKDHIVKTLNDTKTTAPDVEANPLKEEVEQLKKLVQQQANMMQLNALPQPLPMPAYLDNRFERNIEVLQAQNGEFQRADALHFREKTQMENQMKEMQKQLETFKRETETWKVGAWVWAVYPQDQHAYAATVETVNVDGTFNIRWCDGDPAPLLGYLSHQLMERIEPYKDRRARHVKRSKSMAVEVDCTVLDKNNKLLPYDTLLSLYKSWGDGMKHALYIALQDHYNVRMLPEERVTTLQLLETAQNKLSETPAKKRRTGD